MVARIFSWRPRRAEALQRSKMSATVNNTKLYPLHKKFQKKLAMELFFTDLNTAATGLICRKKVLFREFNMKKHYTAKHAKQYQNCYEEKRKVFSEQLYAD